MRKKYRVKEWSLTLVSYTQIFQIHLFLIQRWYYDDDSAADTLHMYTEPSTNLDYKLDSWQGYKICPLELNV